MPSLREHARGIATRRKLRVEAVLLVANRSEERAADMVAVVDPPMIVPSNSAQPLAPSINVSAPNVDIRPAINVEAPHVEYRSQVDVAAPNVTVAAPVVNVEAPNVDVGGAVVEVNLDAVGAALARMTDAIEKLVLPVPEVHFQPRIVMPETPAPATTPRIKRTLVIKHDDGTESTVTEQ